MSSHEFPATMRDAEFVFDGVIERGLRPVTDLGHQRVRLAIKKVGKIYRFTPAEMRVLRAIVEVGGIRDIAVALVVSPTTVKTHLRHIFQKTGTKGQIDLIRLVIRAASSSEK